jgi:hypothetical protein
MEEIAFSWRRSKRLTAKLTVFLIKRAAYEIIYRSESGNSYWNGLCGIERRGHCARAE